MQDCEDCMHARPYACLQVHKAEFSMMQWKAELKLGGNDKKQT